MKNMKKEITLLARVKTDNNIFISWMR